MGKKLKKPKLKKLKVRKLRGGGMDMGSAASQAKSASMAGGDGGVQRDTGLERQRQANIVEQQRQSEARAKTMQNLGNVATVASIFTNPVLAISKFGYSQFKKGQKNAMDYEGQAAGVTPMKTPRVSDGIRKDQGDYSRPTMVAQNTVAPKPLFASNDTTGSASNFMVRPGVRLASLNVANMPKASSQGFMLRPGVALSDVSKASSGKLIKGKPKLAKKGWK